MNSLSITQQYNSYQNSSSSLLYSTYFVGSELPIIHVKTTLYTILLTSLILLVIAVGIIVEGVKRRKVGRIRGKGLEMEEATKERFGGDMNCILYGRDNGYDRVL